MYETVIMTDSVNKSICIATDTTMMDVIGIVLTCCNSSLAQDRLCLVQDRQDIRRVMDSGEYVLGLVTRWGEEQIQYKLVVEYKPEQYSKITRELEDPTLTEKAQMTTKPKSGIPNNLCRKESTASLESYDSGYCGLSL